MGKLLKTMLFCVLTALMFSGCQATTGYYQGALAEADGARRIASALDSPQQWEDLYVRVDSRLVRQGSDYHVSGKYTFSQHPRMMYTRVGHLTLTLFLLDDDYRVIGYRTASRFSMLRPEDEIPFSVTLPAVAGAVAYTFGYEATFVDEEGDSFTHWNLPRTGR